MSSIYSDEAAEHFGDIVDRVRELHAPQTARFEHGGQVCWECRYTTGEDQDWPCATAELVYSKEEIGHGPDW